MPSIRSRSASAPAPPSGSSRRRTHSILRWYCASRGAAFLVGPVRRDAELGVLVHLARADLHLDALRLRPDHGGVDRAVAVALGGRDVVIELARHVGPLAVHDAERRVALGDRVDHHAHRAHVEQLREVQLLALHLAVDAVDVLRTPVDLRRDARAGELSTQFLAQLFDVALAVGAALVERPRRSGGTHPAPGSGRRGPRAPTSAAKPPGGWPAARTRRAPPAPGAHARRR